MRMHEIDSIRLASSTEFQQTSCSGMTMFETSRTLQNLVLPLSDEIGMPRARLRILTAKSISFFDVSRVLWWASLTGSTLSKIRLLNQVLLIIQTSTAIQGGKKLFAITESLIQNSKAGMLDLGRAFQHAP